MHPLTPSTRAVAGAIETRVSAGDVSGALKALAAEWQTLAGSSGEQLRTLIYSVPEAHWENDPWIVTALGASYRTVDSPSRSAALPHFELAEELANTRQQHKGRLPSILLHHAASLRSMGRLDQACAKIEQARQLLHNEHGMTLQPRLATHAQISLQHGLVHLHRGNIAEAVAALRTAHGLKTHGLSPADQVECLGALAFSHYAIGDFRQAELLIASAIEAADRALLHGSAFAAPALITATLIAVDRNRGDDARAHGALLGASAHRSDWEPLAYYARASTAGASGQMITALDLQRRCVTAARIWDGTPLVTTLAVILKATLHRQLGEADRSAREAHAITPTPDHIACPAIVTASIACDSGDYRGCLHALQGCLALGDTHSERSNVSVLILQAAAQYELDIVSSADVAFDQALYFGSVSGSRTPFLTIPRAVLLRMLNRAADRYQPDAVHRVLEELRLGSSTPKEPQEPLSERELEISQYLVHDKTIGEIAAELYISANTVKTHVRAIYRKLSASTRKEAVQRVQELGLDPRITPL